MNTAVMLFLLTDLWSETMIFAALQEAAGRGELLLEKDGLCRWHKRRDGIVVIREILVLPYAHRQGIGKRMLDEIRLKNPGAELLARCPVSYESNRFWEAMGFRLAQTRGGVNEWRLPP